MKKNHCLSCHSEKTFFLFSLGTMPPVNAFILKGQSEEFFPLDLFFCKNCSLIQLGEAVPPARLFSNYLHISSASEGNVRHLHSVVNLLNTLNLVKNKSILEIGSNDGLLLSLLRDAGADVLGVDPAENLYLESKARNVNSIIGFFDDNLAKSLSKDQVKFDSIIALNVMAHTPTFISALRGVKRLLSEDGFFIMENAYVVDTILNGQFDTIYHEHIFCFSLHSLIYAYNLVGLVAVDAEIIPTQGKSIRVFVKHKSSDLLKPSSRMLNILENEKKIGFNLLSSFEAATKKILNFKNKFQSYLQNNSGNKFIGLGAPARGVVILNFCKANENHFEFVIDDTKQKHGKMVPGCNIEVRDWSALNPDVNYKFIVLSWNYVDDIVKKLNALGVRGSILIPFPEFKEITI